MRRTGHLPEPTGSEAAFEHLLETFDPAADVVFAGPERNGDSGAMEPVAAPRPCASSGGNSTEDQSPSANVDRTALDALFANRRRYLERDRFATIGEAQSFYTKIVGVSFEGRQNIVAGLACGDALQLAREPHNPHDADAVAIRYGALPLGYLRREIARHIAPRLDNGERYTATVSSVTGGGERNVGVNIFVRRERRADRRPQSSHRDGVTFDGATGDSVANAALQRALIGEHSLREAQQRVLERLERGRRTLAVMGTGRGKSLCFQLPAARAALERGAKTLVFYPLRALANDQYDALVRLLEPFGLRILRANGSIDEAERERLESALDDGSWDIVLTTPEFASVHRSAFLRSENRPRFIVVDEAHHIFEARHRPAYANLGALVREMQGCDVLALTATANTEAFQAIRSALDIDAWVIDPTVRNNLHVVDARNTADRLGYLAQQLDGGGKAIVYCNSRAEVGALAERLRTRLGPVVAFYHAGIPTPDRAFVEDLFRRGAVRIVVATSAFGEGIDLPDVRDVVLYHLNFAFTEFNQMAGRAGRDSADARIHLLYGEGDRRLNDFLIARYAPSLDVLRHLYRGMRGLAANDVLRLSYEDVARTLSLDMADATTVGTAVRIFEEAKLVTSGVDDDGRFVRFTPVSGKVDLTATARYLEGQAERDTFERFCSLALSADALTLEQIINRPIYPDRVALER